MDTERRNISRKHSKLCKRFFGPFPINAKRGPVAYTLQLPETSRIHPTFHVSQLKPFHGELPDRDVTLPAHSMGHQPLLTPVCILATRVVRKKNQEFKKVLVQWSGRYPEDATWEDFPKFCLLYNQLNLEDKVVFEGDGNDNPVALNMDYNLVGQQVNDWALRGLVDEKEVQPTQSNEEAKIEEIINEPEQEESRRRRKPNWMRDYVI
ncbi:uncharacterized protein [Henckelia pumila]|uniref:uncharacterized protein n=1 Tax=Henckelia pumila TaxID=405737 RepID=UPI003C6E38FB